MYPDYYMLLLDDLKIKCNANIYTRKKKKKLKCIM